MKKTFDYEKVQQRVKKKQIRRNILLVSSITLITLLIMWGLPKVVDLFFYNPKESSAQANLDSYIVNRQINNELTTQNQFLSRYEITAQGYGNYAITEIYRNLAQTQTNTKTYTINRNQIRENQLSIPEGTDYLFEQRFRDATSDMFTDSEFHKEHLLEKVKELPKSTEIIATVIFDHDMDLDALAEWETYNIKDGEIIWTAVRSTTPTADQDYQPIGFADVYSGVRPSERNEDQAFLEKYPFLSLFDATQAQEEDYSPTQQKAAHFTSMLQYLQTQTDFLALEPSYAREILSVEQINDTLAYIKKHGVNSYGISIRVSVDQLKALLQEGDNILAIGVVETTLFNMYD